MLTRTTKLAHATNQLGRVCKAIFASTITVSSHGPLQLYVRSNFTFVACDLSSSQAAGEATKYIPLNNSDFDGVVGPKPCGTLGPHSAAAPPVGDPTQALLLGLVPLFTALAGQQLVSAHTAGPSVFSLDNPPHTPARVSQCSPPSSPLQPDDNELHQFLVALLAKKDIDLLACESQLAALDFTPDILPVVKVSQLKEVTGATDGKVIKMQLFAKEWTKRQEEKRRAHL